MTKSAFLSGILVIGSVTFASAAGGGAAGTAGGAHAGGAHAGSSFGKPAVGNNPFPGVTARPGCVGGITGATSTGAPSPTALPSQLSPSPTNGSAVKGPLQSTPDVARLTKQDQRLLGDIKQANDRLGQVGNSSGTPNGGQQPGQVVGSTDGLQGTGSSRPPPPPQTSVAKESTDRGLAQGKPDMAHMSEQDQRLVREIFRATEKLGTVGNPNAIVGRQPPQNGVQTGPGGDLRRDPSGPHLPVNTMGAASGSAC
jgi:hypothetical protein